MNSELTEAPRERINDRSPVKGKYKPTQAMKLMAEHLINLIEAGGTPTLTQAAQAAGLERGIPYKWHTRYPWFNDWLSHVLQAISPSVLACIAQTAVDRSHSSQVPAAKLHMQIVEGWSERQDVQHMHSGTVTMVPGETDVSHRIAAARQIREAQATAAEGDVIDVTPGQDVS